MYSTILLLVISFFSQTTDFETDLQQAFVNAKKGMYFAFENIPERKSSISNDLIDKDVLIARIKLSKEVQGVKVESEGLCNTYEVKITAYRSYVSLLEAGLIKRIPED